MEAKSFDDGDRDCARAVALPIIPRPPVETAFQALWRGGVMGEYNSRAVFQGAAHADMIWRVSAITIENKRFFAADNRAQLAEIAGVQDEALTKLIVPWR